MANMDTLTMIMMTEDIKKERSKTKVLTSSCGGHMYYDWP